MDTCDRYELHELYKKKLVQMLCDFSIDMLEELNKEESEGICVHFIYQWVEDHIRPI